MRKIKEVNLETGERTVREMTTEENQIFDQLAVEYENEISKAELEAAAKQAAQDKLKALGLTDLEISAITGA